jgi:hypothetical protein
VPVIKANLGIVTQINVFTVPEGGQQALIEFLAEAAKFASSVPGWISASVHLILARFSGPRTVSIRGVHLWPSPRPRSGTRENFGGR